MAEKADEVHENRAKYGEQDAWGNFIPDLRANLKLTPIERLRNAEAFAKGVARLKRAVKRKV